MNPATRQELEKFANEAFSVACDRLNKEHAREQKKAIAEARQTGNVGSYLPALTKCAADKVRATILALADAYAEAFSLFGLPADKQAENSLARSAQQAAAGAISGVQGHLDLLEKRIKQPLGTPSRHPNREIGEAMQSAVKEGKLRLNRQRIKTKTTQAQIANGQKRMKLAGGPLATPKHDSLGEGGAIGHLPELPSDFQDAFEAARAKAELEYAKRADYFPHHPQFADVPVHHVVLIQTVFFAYCEQAVGAYRGGHWRARQVSMARDAAWRVIFDHYFDQEHGGDAKERKARIRSATWKTTSDDLRWKRHLLGLAGINETSPAKGSASTGSALPASIDDNAETRLTAPLFTFKYPRDFPEEEQIAIETARREANDQLGRKVARSPEEYRAAFVEWLRHFLSGAAPAIGRAGATRRWSINQRQRILSNLALGAARVATLINREQQHLGTIFRPSEWQALNDCLVTASEGDVVLESHGGQMQIVRAKGDLQLLQGPDGKPKEAVTLDLAARYGGVSRRAIEKAAAKGSLEAVGPKRNRRIKAASLLRYFPPENNAN